MLEMIYPLLAPLSVPIAEHLLKRFGSQKLTPSATWDMLLDEIDRKREVAFRYMDPFVVTGEFSSGWMLNTLTVNSPDKKPVPPQTFSNWHSRGLIRYEQHGLPDRDSAAALFIARLIDLGERKWLPTKVQKEEPLWWCWRQDSPTHPVIPCPVPLPTSLQPATLLWTPWAGAAWHPEWLSLGNGIGAIRFYGIQHGKQERRWNMTYEDLTHWYPSLLQRDHPLLNRIKEYYNNRVEEMRQQVLRTYATETLEFLALTRFDELRPYAPREGQKS